MKLHVGIQGTILLFKKFRVTPLDIAVTADEAKSWQGLINLLNGANFSVPPFLKASWFAEVV